MKSIVFLFTLIIALWNLSPTVSAQQERMIRVGIIEQAATVTLGSSQVSVIKGYTQGHWEDIATIPPAEGWQVDVAGGQLRLHSPANDYPKLYQRLQVNADLSTGTLVFAGQRWYRGKLDVYPIAAQVLAVVNELPLESYLCGVIPGEMPASWPLEALKAQAVAARTYTISHMGTYAKLGYDVVATTSSQVYGGVKLETDATNRAVAETRGQIMMHNGKPIHAYYHSTSGGRTENGADLWGPFPYLRSVEDYDQQSPKFMWHREFNQTQLKTALGALKVNVGQIMALQPLQRTESGRVKTLRIQGDRGSMDIDGAKVRSALKLDSTFFNVGALDQQGQIVEIEPNQDFKAPAVFQFAGRGWGHGLGMSQWGARQLAADGRDYRTILRHYYTGVAIEQAG